MRCLPASLNFSLRASVADCSPPFVRYRRPVSVGQPDKTHRWPDMSGGGVLAPSDTHPDSLYGLFVQTTGEGWLDKPGSRQLPTSHAPDMVCKAPPRVTLRGRAREWKKTLMPSILCARTRMDRIVIETVLADFDRNGPEAVRRLREQDPAGYAETLCDLLAVRDLLRSEVGDRTKDKGRRVPRPAHLDGANAPDRPRSAAAPRLAASRSAGWRWRPGHAARSPAPGLRVPAAAQARGQRKICSH